MDMWQITQYLIITFCTWIGLAMIVGSWRYAYWPLLIDAIAILGIGLSFILRIWSLSSLVAGIVFWLGFCTFLYRRKYEREWESHGIRLKRLLIFRS